MPNHGTTLQKAGVMKPAGYKHPMIILRNILFWLILIVVTIPFFVVVVLSALIPGGLNHSVTAWARFVVWLMRYITGMRYRVIGREHIPDKPAVIACKHQSGWETFATQSIFPLQVFVAKRELFKIPIFGWSLKMSGTIGIDRGNPYKANQQILEQGKKRKARGLWITIFPEGTRIPPGYRGRYKAGAARMAKLLDMPIVPVALNSGEFWPKTSWLKYPGEITVVIAPVIDPASGDIAQLTAKIEEEIESRQGKIQGIGPFADLPPQVPTPTWQPSKSQ